MGKINHNVHTGIKVHIKCTESPCKKCGGTDFLIEKKFGKYLDLTTSTCEKCGTVQENRGNLKNSSR
jgi:uncharacterized Zn finger protein